MLISYYANKKKFPKVAVVATKLNFLQYTYRFRINNKTLYSQKFLFQDTNLQTYIKMACVISVLWPAIFSNAVDVSLSGGSLGYWTACNNVKRDCTLH